MNEAEVKNPGSIHVSAGIKFQGNHGDLPKTLRAVAHSDTEANASFGPIRNRKSL